LKRILTLENKFPIRIFFLAIIIRLIPVLFSYNLSIGLDDMFQYDMLARSIESGNGYRWYAQEDLNLVKQYFNFDMSNVDYDPRGVLTSFRPPLYPAYLALIYFIFGVGAKRFFIARLSQVILSAALVPLTYYVSRILLPGREKVRKIASWIIALYPMLVIYPLSLATENLFFLLILLSFYILLLAENKRRWYWFALAGILLGFTALTRSVALAFAGLAVIWVGLFLKEYKYSLIVFLSVCIITLPWMVRNTILHHQLTGIESALGYDLYVGYHPESTGTFQYGISLDLMPYLDDGVRDEIGQSKALEFIRSNPDRIPYLTARRLGYFWGLERRALTYFYSNNYFGYIPALYLIPISIVLLLPFVLLCIFASFGFAAIKWNKVNILLFLLILGYLTPHIFILGEDRFHLTLVPFLAIAAAHWWGESWQEIRQRWQASSGKIAIMLALIISLLLIINWTTELLRDRTILSLLFSPGGNVLYLPY
jgi:hypothetical protein